jgi:Tfp pilus assembly protein PilF
VIPPRGQESRTAPLTRPRVAAFALAAALLVASLSGCRSARSTASGLFHLGRAYVFLHAEKAVFARAEYAAAKAEQPQDAALFERFAVEFAKFRQWKDAAKAYEDALRVKPDAGTAVVLAQLYWDAPTYGIERQASRIEATLKLAVSLAPNDPSALNNLAYFYAEEGRRLSLALKMSQRAVSLAPTDAAVLDTLGWVYSRMGRQNEAVAVLERAVELDWRSRELRSHLAAACQAAGQTRRADVERRKAQLLGG